MNRIDSRLRRRFLGVAGLLTMALIRVPVFAGDLAPPVALDGTLSLRSDVWQHSRDLDLRGPIATSSAWARFKVDLDSAGDVVGSGWLRGEAGSGKSGETSGLVRELYWRRNLGSAELRLGRQMVVWGRADAINPTDNLSPRDYTLLVPEDADQRYGNTGAQVSVDGNLGTFYGLWFPSMASHNLPLPINPALHYDRAPLRYHPQLALKWEGRGDNVDGSISYFHGTDLTPDLYFGGMLGDQFKVQVKNRRLDVIGADISMSRNQTVWRAEAAYTFTDSSGERDFTHKKSQFKLVAGGEWRLSEATSLGLQAVVRRVSRFSSPDTIDDPAMRAIAWAQADLSDQASRWQRGLVWRLAGNWWNDTLQMEFSGLQVWPGKSGALRTKIAYAISDRWHVRAGSDYYFGADHSFWGQLKGNRNIYVQLRYTL
ncbi:hypothetical protein [Collimonas humicola]|uniref:hypothetical protein n=1 Tax=Collimonas humicola TaxID=2825886 RepID=UPI001B8D7BFB|nr:hypothetical protein [Collimonas humicola]